MITDNEIDINSLSPLSLAFIGDTVFDLLVRCELLEEGNRPVNILHKSASERVCAAAQKDAALILLPELNAEEAVIFKRGRNTHTNSSPKNQSSADYHYATGLECLFGWLYLKGRDERIRELYGYISEKCSDE